MRNLTTTFVFIGLLMTLPVITIGIIRKVKARLQNRIGPPVLQPVFNLIKLFGKGEIQSTDSTWLFKFSASINLAAALYLAFLVPWLPFKPDIAGDDIFLVVYLFALIRFFTIISSLDAGSAFGAFGASREATLSTLTEPAIVLAFVSLGISAGSTDFSQMFASNPNPRIIDVALWTLAGMGFFLTSLVELSRMPIDDPTTHLELTMVHEAMTIENSGPNLALVELAYAVRMLILYGLIAQCFIHALLALIPLSASVVTGLSVILILVLAAVTALIESFSLKLAWKRNPEFIAYALTMSLLASLVAISRGVIG